MTKRTSSRSRVGSEVDLAEADGRLNSSHGAATLQTRVVVKVHIGAEERQRKRNSNMA